MFEGFHLQFSIENRKRLLPVHYLMVVQKLEAQHDAGCIEPAGGDDENIKLTLHKQ